MIEPLAPPTATTAALERLDERGLRRTGARSAVIAAALRRRRPFTAQELVTVLAPSGIGRATVFRTLDHLVRVGALGRVHGMDGEQCARYIPCAPEHHHHLVCRGCGRLEEIPAEKLEAGIGRVAAARGFTVLGHTIEIEGLCPRCRA